MIGSASADWANICSVTIHPSVATTCSDYTITSPQFNAPVKAHSFNGGALTLNNDVLPTVYLTIEGRGINETLTLSTSDPTYTSLDNNFQIIASSFPAANSLIWEYSQYNPSVVLTISRNPEPTLSISIKSESKEYYSGEQIKWTVEVKNTGTITAQDVTLQYPSHADMHLDNIFVNQIIKYDFYTKSSLVNISVSSKTKIAKDTQTFIFNGTGTTIIKPALQNIYLYKTIKSRIYTEKNIVTISIANSGSFTATNLQISDQYKTTGTLHSWKSDTLSPGTSLTYTYIVNTTQSGSFISPPAVATFEINSIPTRILSDKVAITVVSMGNQESLSQDELYIAPVASIIATPAPIGEVIPEITSIPTPQPQIITPNNQLSIQTPPPKHKLPTLGDFNILEIPFILIVVTIIIKRKRE